MSVLLFCGMCVWNSSSHAAKTATSTRTYPTDRLIIRGNIVFNDHVYLALEPIPELINVGDARALTRRWVRFLHKAGYELATAELRATEDAIYIDIDEGQLDKVIFLQQGSLRTIQLKLLLDLPHDVFNRPHLEQRLAEVRDRFGFVSVGYELVEAARVDHSGPQMAEIPMSGIPLVPPQRHKELRVSLTRQEWSAGRRLWLRYTGLDGLVFGVGYRSEDSFFERDRGSIGGSIGFRRDELRSKNREDGVGLSVLALEGRWFTPPLFGIDLRPMLRLHTGLFTRQRFDLGIDRYYNGALEGALNLSYGLGEGFFAAVGFGWQQRYIFGIQRIEDNPTEFQKNVTQSRGYIGAEVELDIDPNVLRRDHHHLLNFDIRAFRSLQMYRMWYQKRFGLGWHELWIYGRGALLTGNVLFADEEPIGGRYTRATYPNDLFARRAFSLTAEFRWSLARDIYHVSFFHDGAVFQDPLADPARNPVRFANSFGAGFHALIVDSFQADIYYGWGFATDMKPDRGIALRVRQAF